MHMKIEINHPENISPPPRNFSNPLNKLNTTGIILTPPEKIPNTSESISTPPKKLNPSRKNLNLIEKLPLPKNSITITETISNTRTKSQPLPKKSHTLSKKCQPLPKNLNPAPKKCQPLPKKCHLYRKNVTLPEIILTPLKFLNPPPQKHFSTLSPQNFSPPP